MKHSLKKAGGKNMSKQKGLFVVFEGGEGSGKSTQVKMLTDWLSRNGYAHIATKEPGDPQNNLCSAIRDMLLNPQNSDMAIQTELLLFEADRAQHIQKIIAPAMEQGMLVVCDRYEASTFAYQCGGRGLSRQIFFKINDFATAGLKPNIVFWMDIDPASGLSRAKAIKQQDRMEAAGLAFHQRVRAGFAEFFSIQGENVVGINASLRPEEIHEIVIGHIQKLLAGRETA